MNHKEQQQQQQMQRQQQALQFQRQQEQLRKQKHEKHQLTQDQLHHQQGQVDQQKQQQFLKNFERSSALSGATVVNIAPSEQESLGGGSTMTGVNSNSATTNEPTPAATTPTSNPPRSDQSNLRVGKAAPLQSKGTPLTNGGQPVKQTSGPPDNTVVLVDGTIIIIRSADEILFRGPTGVEMMVNCLPLYNPPPFNEEDEDEVDSEQNSESDRSGSSSPDRTRSNGQYPARKSISLMKSRSAEALDTVQAELELHDHDFEDCKSDEEVYSRSVTAAPKKWSRMSTSYSKNLTVMVHNVKEELPQDELPQDRAEGELPQDELPQDRAEGEQPQDRAEGELLQDELPQDRAEGELPQDRAEGELSQDRAEGELPQDRAEGELSQDIAEGELPQDRAEGELLQDRAKGEVENGEGVENGADLSLNADEASQPSLHTVEVGLKDASEGEGVEGDSGGGKPEYQVQVSEVEEIRNMSMEVSTDLAKEERGGEDNTAPASARAKRQASRSKKRHPVRSVKSSSPISSSTEIENGSDEEDDENQGLTVNYLDSSTMSTLKRSSGSVSFYHRTDLRAKSPSPTPMETSIEESCQEADDQPSIVVATRTLISGGRNSPPSTPPSSCLTPPYTPTIPLVTHSLLPPPPPTLDQDYVERSGWLNKLSHRRGVFGDKWQKRYFVLHRSWLYYFKKYGDSNPRGAIRLLPSGWSRPISQGSMRMSDAVVKSNDQKLVSVLRCIAVHRPSNFSASLCDLLAADGVAEAFRSQTISVMNVQHSSRTYYMVAPSDPERLSWVESINKNMRAYAYSSEALTTACKELKIMLRAVNCAIAPKHIPSLLYLLNRKRKSVLTGSPPLSIYDSIVN